MVDVPCVQNRSYAKDGRRFGSSVIPKYIRRSGKLEAFIPLLYLKGESLNDFVEALTPLVGENAKNLSPGVVSRLKADSVIHLNWR